MHDLFDSFAPVGTPLDTNRYFVPFTLIGAALGDSGAQGGVLKAVDMTAMTYLRRSMIGWTAFVAASVLLAGLVSAMQRPATDPGGTTGRVTLSIVGTTDLHGRVFPNDGRGGLALLGGYLRNLREARAADGGAVLLLDAGDTFQGGIASNLSEGALVVDAYNALGCDAIAIGSHEFEYRAVDTASGDGPQDGPPDMRGALKAAAARARFPFLAANVIDTTTGRPLVISRRTRRTGRSSAMSGMPVPGRMPGPSSVSGSWRENPRKGVQVRRACADT